jgi:osmotically-inducible protein OsmY
MASVGVEAAVEKLPDGKIGHAIETDLILDEEVSAHLIDVTVKEGIATLSGTVDNILARDRAVNIAGRIKGVRAVINRLDIRPIVRPDDAIRADIETALALDPATDSMEIDVAVSEGAVTLSGEVESWAEKNLASTVVKGVKGVVDVANDIDIDFDAKRPADEIRADIDRRLENDIRIDDELITVRVKKNMVRLTGVVGSVAEKKLAWEDAMVNGVEQVNTDKLDVEWWARDSLQRKSAQAVDDQTIVEAIYDAYAYDPRVSSANPNVEAEAGAVTLSGTVSDLAAKYAAAQTARQTAGVVMVTNLLRVRPMTVAADSTIEKLARAALRRDPYLEMRELEVTARNGKVYVYGRVNSEFERRRATDVVSRVSGVIDMENNIEALDSWEHATDMAISRRIESKYAWSSKIDREDISVTVDNGVVTLTGAADTWSERLAAAELAWDAGARYVKNDIAIAQ